MIKQNLLFFVISCESFHSKVFLCWIFQDRNTLFIDYYVKVCNHSNIFINFCPNIYLTCAKIAHFDKVCKEVAVNGVGDIETHINLLYVVEATTSSNISIQKASIFMIGISSWCSSITMQPQPNASIYM